MEFRTPMSISASRLGFIDHQDKILCLGSCFAENIGKKLKQAQFKVKINPYGILFHPIAIENSLMRIATNTKYTEEDLAQYKLLYFTWDHHSSFSHHSPAQLLDTINREMESAHLFLRKTSCCILTLGTAWVYLLKESNLAVANCHKMPAGYFKKELLSISQIETSLHNITTLLRRINPGMKIILSISPVRHLKDGFVENNHSKSRLIEGVQNTVDIKKNIDYFPAYELLLDDLRDYRFYKEDFVHPNEQGINYIYEAFTKFLFNTKTKALVREIEKISNAVEHKAIFSGSKAHLEFLENTLQKITSLKPFLPEGSFIQEILMLKSQMDHVN